MLCATGRYLRAAYAVAKSPSGGTTWRSRATGAQGESPDGGTTWRSRATGAQGESPTGGTWMSRATGALIPGLHSPSGRTTWRSRTTGSQGEGRASKTLVATGLVALSFLVGAWYYQNALREYFRGELTGAANSLAENKILFEKPVGWVEQTELIQQLQRLSQDKENLTLVLCGQRGVGKTSLVKAALEGNKGVLKLSYKKDEFPSIEEGILQALGIQNPQSRDLRKVLQMIKKSSKKSKIPMPTLVFDVNEKWSSESVNQLLYVARDLGEEYRLAKFVLVFSASINAFDLECSLGQMRGLVMEVPNPPQDDIKKCLSAKFDESFPERRNEWEDLLDLATETADETFLGCTLLTVKLRDKLSEEGGDMKTAIEAVKKANESKYTLQIGLCLERLGVQSKNSLKAETLTKLLKGPVHRRELNKVFSASKVTEMLVKCSPYPFYVDPSDMVTLSTQMAKNALRKELDSLPRTWWW